MIAAKDTYHGRQSRYTKKRSGKFPLTLHPTGQYCKKIRGKLYCLGSALGLYGYPACSNTRMQASGLSSCPVYFLHPGPRTMRPGFVPVCSPCLSTCVPFTKTWSIPVAYWCGFSNVAWSIIRSGSKITMSA